MKNLREVKARLDEIKDEMDNIVESSRGEKRELTTEEQDALDALQTERDNLIELATELIDQVEIVDQAVDDLEGEVGTGNEEEVVENKRKTIDIKKMKKVRAKPQIEERVTLASMIQKAYRNKGFSDYENELIRRGQNELIQSGISNFGDLVIPSKRASYQAGTTGQGAENVATELMDIVTPVWANQVLQSAGATFLTGNVGNIEYPLLSRHNADWQTEVGPAIDGAGSFKTVKLSPKRLTAFVDVSKQMLIQDNSGNLETIINTEIVKAVSNKLESTLLGNAAATPTQPAGLFNTFAPGVLTPTWAEVIDLEAQMEMVDLLGSKKVVMNPTIKGLLKSTQRDAGSGLFLMNDDNTLNGYDTLSTSNSFALIMGDFSRYLVANWGGTDITLDPYSLAINGVVRIVINTFWDAAALYDVSLTGQPKPFITTNI